MIKYDAYESDYMTDSHMEKISITLNEFLIDTEDNNLNYEVETIKDITPIFITGKNQDEKELPVWTQPLIVVGARGKKYLVTNLRGLIKNLSSDFINLGDVAINRDAVNFHIQRAILIMIMSDGHGDDLGPVRDSIIFAFGKWLSELLGGMLMLSPMEKLDTLVICVHWYVRVMYNKTVTEDDNFDVFKTFNITTQTGTDRSWIEKTVDGLIKDPKGVDDLIVNLKRGVDTPKFNGIDKMVLYNVVGRSTFLGVDIPSIAIDHSPTWIALMYASLNNKGYQKTKTGMILDRIKRNLNHKELTRFLENQVDDNLIK